MCDLIEICEFRASTVRISHWTKCICATYIRRTCGEASHSVSATTGPLSFLNLPVQLNFTLWYSTISHCARLVTQIILSLSKYGPPGPRIVSTAQSGTKYPYLPPAVSNREESTLSKLDPLCSKISRFTYSRNDLSLLLRTALVIATGAPFAFRRTRSCVRSYALRSILLTFKILFFSLLCPCAFC